MNVRSDIAEGTRAGKRDARGRLHDDGPPQKRGRGRPLVDDKRRRILDAALKTFAARGYHGTAVPEVAEAAGVGTGTLYRYFESKEALVNELYRDAKQRLKAALLDDLPTPDAYKLDGAEHWFRELWRRLAAFARAEPEAFRFLEMQDHVEYLDERSRALELSVLAPLWLTGKRLLDRSAGPPVDVAIALLWGAFVGLVKASRLGYLPLDDRKLDEAGAAAWRVIAPDLPTIARAPRASRVGSDRPAGTRTTDSSAATRTADSSAGTRTTGRPAGTRTTDRPASTRTTDSSAAARTADSSAGTRTTDSSAGTRTSKIPRSASSTPKRSRSRTTKG